MGKRRKLKNWILPIPSYDTKVSCKYCKVIFRAHHGDLFRHCETEKHRKNAASFSNTRTLFQSGFTKKEIDITVKMAEVQIAAHIACHSSIITVGHLGEIISNISGKNISIHRTKLNTCW